LKVLFQRHYC